MPPGDTSRDPRGDALLLQHLAAVARMTREDGGRAQARLEAELGPDAARRIVGSLSQRVRSTRPLRPLTLS